MGSVPHGRDPGELPGNQEAGSHQTQTVPGPNPGLRSPQKREKQSRLFMGHPGCGVPL